MMEDVELKQKARPSFPAGPSAQAGDYFAFLTVFLAFFVVFLAFGAVFFVAFFGAAFLVVFFTAFFGAAFFVVFFFAFLTAIVPPREPG
jgi:hypothetical protein